MAVRYDKRRAPSLFLARRHIAPAANAITMSNLACITVR